MSDRASFVLPLRVRYVEVDVQGVVFHGHYLTYFDLAITEFLRARGVADPSAPNREGADFHVVRTEVNYRRPLLLDQAFKVCCAVEHLGRSSVTFALTLEREGETLSDGKVVWVYTDQTTRKAVPLSPQLRTLLAPTSN